VHAVLNKGVVHVSTGWRARLKEVIEELVHEHGCGGEAVGKLDSLHYAPK
jgi:hypothetical protein